MAKKKGIADIVTEGLVRSDYDRNELRATVREQMQREREALRLYEPLQYQQQFHSCTAQKCLIQKGNRTGGTLANMVEVARAVTGQDPFNKYPKTNGTAAILGYGESHIGTVFHKMLFQPGAFDIIRDENTKKWRTYRPWPQSEGGDEHRAAEKKPAPPLIPKRFIDGRIAWVKRGEGIFARVKFTTGWQLLAKNSSGDPGQAQGFDAHLYAVDEDLATGGWYAEIIGRIARVKGLLRWSALPHAKNQDLMTLINQAEEEKEQGEEKPSTVVIRATIFDNPYFDRASRDDSLKTWKALGEDEYRKRMSGEINLDSVLMYPTYNRRIHCVLRREGEPLTPLLKILADRQGEPPNDWTRFMVVDPGHTVCAVLFCATPPPELGRQRVVYQEAYIRNANASHFGEALDLYARDMVFEKFIIDMHGANLTSSGDGLRPLEHYTAELTKRGLKCEQTGGMFSAGCDRIGLREECLRNWLAIERDGQPTILIVNERCPNLVREMETFKKKTTRIGNQDVPLDEGNRRANTHAVECLEYFAADGGEYIKPRTHAIELSHVDRVLALDAKRERIQRHMAATFGKSHSINLGPQGVPVT
jgi:hypothetical protein